MIILKDISTQQTMLQQIRILVRTCCYLENVLNLIARVNLCYTITVVILTMAFDVCMPWSMGLSGHLYSLRSTSSTIANTPDIVTSTGDFEDSHTGDEATACDISCDEHMLPVSSNGTYDEAPAFRPFLLETGYC